MRTCVTILLVLALAGVVPLWAADKPAAAKGLAGTWEGALKVGGMELKMIFKIKKKDAGWTGTLDVPLQGAKDVALDTVSLKDAKVFLELKAAKAEFEGTLAKDGAAIEGKWKQSGGSYPLTLKRTDKVSELRRPQLPAKPYPYAEEEVTYENKKAGVKFAGTLTRPRSGGPFAAVLLITGSGPQDRDEQIFGHRPFLILADHLTRRGIAVLRVDDRGVGGSTGDTMSSTTDDFTADALAGIAYLKGRQDIDPKRIGLMGHSEGGLIAPLAASRSADVAFIVMLAGTGLPGEDILYLQGAAILKAETKADAKALAKQRALQERLFVAVKEEKDPKTLEKRVQAIMDEEKTKLTQEEKKEAGDFDAAIKGQIKMVLSPWFRYFLTYDPRVALKKVHCPVLALNGSKDTQVDAKANLEAIAAALKEGGNPDVTTTELPGLNHLFQTCTTGGISEYGSIEETFAPAALAVIADWIVKHTAK